jgi:TM2 domain-containing membrane protein YozV
MAIYIHCPHCHQRLADVQQDCPHCHQELPIGVLYALSAALGKTPMPPPMPPGLRPTHLTRPPLPATPPVPPARSPAAQSRWRPWLAATLSLCCGLGQLYNGQVVKGLILMALGAVAVVSAPFLIGKLLIPAVWLFAIGDAFFVAHRRRVPPSPRLAVSPHRH